MAGTITIITRTLTNADSVPSYSPLIVKINNQVEIISIEELWDRILQEPHLTVKEQIKDIANENIHVFRGNAAGGKHWEKIKRIFRHEYKGELVLLRCPKGMVEVTPNHSIIVNCHPKEAHKVKVGDKLTIPRAKLGRSCTDGFFAGSENLLFSNDSSINVFAFFKSFNSYLIKAKL